jgi:alkanesulfonate monooxygenase SsuD/methylene tetrahydromethanopterin reductase-like flavin-dependent oxidoreductase (luciferase family)
MRAYYFTEEPYPDAWKLDAETLRVTLPNRLCDPVRAANLYHQYLDGWQLCDELGLDIFVNEHHSTTTCLTASCNVILAILARTTKRARLLGLGFPIAVRNDPVRLAEELAMIDVISRGRLDMGFIKGVPFEYHPSNTNAVHMASRFAEAQDLIIKALTTHDGPFSWEGEHFQYRNVNIWPRPYQQPHPPVWNSCLSPSSVATVARDGHVMGTIFAGYKTKDLFEVYRRVWQESGRVGSAPLDRLAYSGFVAVGETEDEGIRRGDMLTAYFKTNAIVAEPFKNPPGYIPAAAGARMIKQTGTMAFHGYDVLDRDGHPIAPFATADARTMIAGGLMFAGTPDQVFEQLVDFYEHVGGFGNLLMMAQAGTMGPADTAASLTLFAREVLPRLSDHMHRRAQEMGQVETTEVRAPIQIQPAQA